MCRPCASGAWADSISLNAIASPAARGPRPFAASRVCRRSSAFQICASAFVARGCADFGSSQQISDLIVYIGQILFGEGALLGLPRRVSFVITAADRPLSLPRNWPNAGTKSPLDRPCRYSRGSTLVISGVLRAHEGRIAGRTASARRYPGRPGGR